MIKNIIAAIVALVVSLGAIIGFWPDAPVNFAGTTGFSGLRIGDIEYQHSRDDTLSQATTTICALQAPAATSTLEAASLSLTIGTTTASTITFAKAATAFATTTQLYTYNVSAGAQAAISLPATTTQANMDKYVFAPNTYFVVGMQGSAGTFSPTGVCSAVWRSAI